jgi:hypothetical protein
MIKGCVLSLFLALSFLLSVGHCSTITGYESFLKEIKQRIEEQRKQERLADQFLSTLDAEDSDGCLLLIAKASKLIEEIKIEQEEDNMERLLAKLKRKIEKITKKKIYARMRWGANLAGESMDDAINECRLRLADLSKEMVSLKRSRAGPETKRLQGCNQLLHSSSSFAESASRNVEPLLVVSSSIAPVRRESFIEMGESTR